MDQPYHCLAANFEQDIAMMMLVIKKGNEVFDHLTT